jgi:hypothetical protein
MTWWKINQWSGKNMFFWMSDWRNRQSNMENAIIFCYSLSLCTCRLLKKSSFRLVKSEECRVWRALIKHILVLVRYTLLFSAHQLKKLVSERTGTAQRVTISFYLHSSYRNVDQKVIFSACWIRIGCHLHRIYRNVVTEKFISWGT